MPMEMFYLDPIEIKIKEGLDRFRTDPGDLEDLAQSLQDKGQIVPIIINNNKELIDGGRRVAACMMAQIKVLCVYKDTVNPIIMRELEIESNVRRKAFTPSEEVLAISELHKLKQSVHGEATSGRKGGWTLDDTAKTLGVTKGKVIADLQLAEVVKMFPSLKDCKTKKEIVSAAKGVTKVLERSLAVSNYEKLIKDSNITQVRMYHLDGKIHMLSMENNSVDLLLTDPPYGIGINEVAMTVGGVTGGHVSAGFQYSDTPETTLNFLTVLAQQSFRFCKPTAHAFIFIGFEYFEITRKLFIEAGWQVRIKPLIWIKREIGQCNVPYAWPSSCYETILMARKDNSKLIVEGKPDWFQHDPVLPSQRLHQAEKPVELLKELIRRTCLPGSMIYDPAMGSGSTLEAALRMNMLAIGCDIMEESYSGALQRITQIIQ